MPSAAHAGAIENLDGEAGFARRRRALAASAVGVIAPAGSLTRLRARATARAVSARARRRATVGGDDRPGGRRVHVGVAGARRPSSLRYLSKR